MAGNSRLTLATHALCWLALADRHGSATLTSQQIAASIDCQPTEVRRLLAPLRDAGLVGSGRGPGAGWTLNRPADEITMLDVHDALGSERPFALHAHRPDDSCPVGHGIRPVLSEVYDDVERATADALRRHTVADLLDTILREHPVPRWSAEDALSR